MLYTNEDLELAKRQVSHAEKLIIQHQKIIDRLLIIGEPTRLAERLKARMSAGLDVRQKHIAIIEQQLGRDPQSAANEGHRSE